MLVLKPLWVEIPKHIPKHPEIEHIPYFQLLQISKHGLAGHSAVTGEYAVGASSSNGQRASQQVSHTFAKNAVAGAMVNW